MLTIIGNYIMFQNNKGVIMKNKFLNSFIIILTLVITIFNLFGMIIRGFFYNINDLPEGEFLFSALSNDTLKTVKIYKVDVPKIGKGIRGEVVFNENGEDIKKNIYWQTNKETAIVSWVNNEVVSINNINININESPFDSRKQIIIPEVAIKNKGLS